MIYSYQRPVYQALRRSAAAHQAAEEMELPIRPRFHRLVIGPTGTGKSHLAAQVGQELGWAVFNANVSGWIVLGSKERPTYHSLIDWLVDVEPGRPVMIVLDEIDKISGEDSWTRFLRGELYSLLDGRFIVSDYVLDLPEDAADDLGGKLMDAAEARLRSAWFIGCGAFQNLQDEKPGVGFGSLELEPPGPDKLSGSLQRELVNRFHQETLVLPKLVRADYEDMVAVLTGSLEGPVASAVSGLAPTMVSQAITAQAGARFAENLLCRAVEELTGGRPATPWVPPELTVVVPEKAPPTEDELWDVLIPIIDNRPRSGQLGACG